MGNKPFLVRGAKRPDLKQGVPKDVLHIFSTSRLLFWLLRRNVVRAFHIWSCGNFILWQL